MCFFSSVSALNSGGLLHFHRGLLRLSGAGWERGKDSRRVFSPVWLREDLADRNCGWVLLGHLGRPVPQLLSDSFFECRLPFPRPSTSDSQRRRRSLLEAPSRLPTTRKPPSETLPTRCGPFKVLQRVGHLAHKLDCSPSWRIHPAVAIARLAKAPREQDPSGRKAKPPGAVIQATEEG